MASGLFFPDPEMRNGNESGEVVCRAVQRIWSCAAPDADVNALVVGRNGNGFPTAAGRFRSQAPRLSSQPIPSTRDAAEQATEL